MENRYPVAVCLIFNSKSPGFYFYFSDSEPVRHPVDGLDDVLGEKSQLVSQCGAFDGDQQNGTLQRRGLGVIRDRFIQNGVPDFSDFSQLRTRLSPAIANDGGKDFLYMNGFGFSLPVFFHLKTHGGG